MSASQKSDLIPFTPLFSAWWQASTCSSVRSAWTMLTLALLICCGSAWAQDGQLPASSIQRLGLTAQQQAASPTRGVIRPGSQLTTRADPSVPQVIPWTAATACPAPAFRYAFAQNGEDFYVISGVSTGPNTNAVRRYNATTNVWMARANIPAASQAPAGAFFGGKIYVATGDGAVNAFYIYNVATDTWSTGPPRPGVVDSYGAAAGAYNGNVYIVGGGAAGPTSTVSIYNIAANTWSVGPAAPSPVQLAGDAQVGQYLYVIGGFTATVTNSTVSMRLDMATNTWSTGPTFTPQRGDFALAAAGSKLFAIGGDATGLDFFDPTALVDELDTSTWPAGTWVPSPDNLPSVRQGNSAGFVSTGRIGGEIWTTGGANATFISEHLFRAVPDCLSYTFTASSGAIVPGTVDTGNHTDDGSTVIALPFSYQLYDQTFTNVAVGSNGHLTFGTVNNSFSVSCIPIATATYAIGPYWTDQCTGPCTGVTGTTYGIFTSISGVAPNRIFNIEWRTAYYNSGGTGVPLNYEVRLYEGQTAYDVIYGVVPPTFTPPAARNLSVGVQKNNTATQFTLEGCDSTGGGSPPVTAGQLYHYTLAACAPSGPTGLLYVLNAKTLGNQIYAFSVSQTTGLLTLLPGFPLATGGTGTGNTVSELLALDSVNQRLYAINDGSDTVSAYSIDSTTGALTLMPFSPIALGAGNWAVAAVHPTGSPLIVGNSLATEVRSYTITATTATEAAGSPFASAPPFSSTFSRDGAFYYVGGNSGTTFAGFSVNTGTGVLTALAGSPFNSGSSDPMAYATDSQGRFLTANYNAGALRVFTTSAGVPTAVTGNPFASGLTQAVDGVLHPNEQFYFVADRSGNRFGSYRMSGSGAATTLTPVTGSPFASGGTFTDALVMNQTGSFLYGANGSSRNLTTYSVNSNTGVLTNQIVQAANTLGTTGILTGIAYTNSALVRTAVSRKTHGAAGVFDINLPLTGTPGIECRTSAVAGDQQIVVTFAVPIQVGAIVVVSGIFGGGSSSVTGQVVTVNLTGVANAQTLTLEFQNVTDGVNTSTFRVPVSYLLGDTGGNGTVNASDIGQTKAQSGQAATGSNFRTDVNVNGTINAADIGLVKSKSGTSLP